MAEVNPVDHSGEGNPMPILDTVTLLCRLRRTGERSFNIVLVQGLNRQIRRMCEALGANVTHLRRVRIMNLRIGKLKPGEWRELTEDERLTLFEALEQREQGTGNREQE